MPETQTQIQWINATRKVGELVPHHKNPRQITPKQRADLITSLEKFNLAEIPVINTDNQIIAGHQRIKILYDIYGANHEIDVRIPNRELTKEEVEEYLIRSNANRAGWDFEKLADFDSTLLGDWGFPDDEWPSFDDDPDIGSEQVTDNSAEDPDPMIERTNEEFTTDQKQNLEMLAGYKTAMKRTEISTPVRHYQKMGLLTDGDILDYGGGLDPHNYTKFDPAYHAQYELLNNYYDIVMCNYVLNVIPLFHNKAQAAISIRSLLNPVGYALLAVYSKDEMDTYSGSGYQCGWTKTEWQEFLTLFFTNTEPIPAPFWCFKCSN